VSITDRDRKIILLLVPLLLVGVYWFLLLAPQREQAASLGEQLAQAQSDRQTAEAQLALAETAKANAGRDYASVVKLGKAIPTTVDTPSLIVQLDSAARGTGIDFARITTGERVAAVATTAAPTTAGGDTPAAAAGGEQAGTGPGKAVEAANNVAGQAPAGGGETATTAAAGLDSVPLEFTFNGSFFELADFFHQLKRFVRAADGRLDVHGRLMTVDGFTLTAGEDFPNVQAEVTSTVYLSPLEGTAGGLGVAPETAAAAAPAGAATSESPAPATPAPSTNPPISTVTPR
jgi:hypothetical protein